MGLSEFFAGLGFVAVEVLLYFLHENGLLRLRYAALLSAVAFTLAVLTSDWARQNLWRRFFPVRLGPLFPKFDKGIYKYRRRGTNRLRFRFGGGHGLALGTRSRREALPIAGHL
jgi:hypothetical protein